MAEVTVGLVREDTLEELENEKVSIDGKEEITVADIFLKVMPRIKKEEQSLGVKVIASFIANTQGEFIWWDADLI
ncbi:hypothetical protein M1506_03410 [Patescibacteria group bacterium]|nr:hypothetical protein [Patescibacteria group bacterium]